MHDSRVEEPVCKGLEFPVTDARVTTLPNGLEIIVKEDKSAPVVSVQAWVRTGSIHEGEWMGAGLSHFVEHMFFKGTPSRKGSEIARQVQEVGGYINAYTSFDRTVYWIDAPKEGLNTAIDVLSDALQNGSFPEEEVAKEQEVIRREMAMGADDPSRTLSKMMFSTAFQVHPYRFPVIGYEEVFDRVGREELVDYYEKRYVPNQMFFVVTGDVNADMVVAQVALRFAEAERAAERVEVVPSEPMQLGRREVHEDFETDHVKAAMSWRIPGVTHGDMPSLDVLALVFREGAEFAFGIGEIREEAGIGA